MEFNKENRSKLADEIIETLKRIEEKYGLTITKGSGSYDEISYSLKLEIKTNEINGIESEQYEFNKYCNLYSFKEEDYKKTFTFKNEEYILLGFYSNSNKYTVKGQKISDGKIYGFTPNVVREILGKG